VAVHEAVYVTDDFNIRLERTDEPSSLLWPPCAADADIIFYPVVAIFLLMATLWNMAGHDIFVLWLWPPCVADADIRFLPCDFYLSFFPRLISAVGDWMSTILPHMAWP